MIEHELHEGAARRVPDENGRLVELTDQSLEARDDLRHRHSFDRRRIGIERLDLDVEARIRGGEDAKALRLVVRDPMLPAPRRDPETVDEYDGVWYLRGALHPCLPVCE